MKSSPVVVMNHYDRPISTVRLFFLQHSEAMLLGTKTKSPVQKLHTTNTHWGRLDAQTGVDQRARAGVDDYL